MHGTDYLVINKTGPAPLDDSKVTEKYAVIVIWVLVFQPKEL